MPDGTLTGGAIPGPVLLVTTKAYGSVGFARVFNGVGLGAGRPVRVAIVVVVVLERLMRLASGSVPVFTAQRSTPHVTAKLVEAGPNSAMGRTRPSARLSA